MAREKIILLTGKPFCGKSYVAERLRKWKGFEEVLILDEKILRSATGNYRKDFESRRLLLEDVMFMAFDVSRYQPVIVEFCVPEKKVREHIKKKYYNIIEVYLKASDEFCQKKDNTGIWRYVLDGKIHNVPGIDIKYEEPEMDDDSLIIIDRDKYKGNKSATRLVMELKVRK